MAKYIELGRWKVSKAFPQSDLDLLIQDFERWEKGQLPRATAFPLVPDDMKRKDLDSEALYESAKKLFVPTDKSGCYAAQVLCGSTCELPPNPFVIMRTYFAGAQLDDYERIRDTSHSKLWTCPAESEIIEGHTLLWSVDPMVFLAASDRDSFFEDGKKPNYDARTVINLKTRESRVEPAD